MTSPFPELRTLALIESAEAVATNAENAVLFEIGRVVGTEDVIMPSLAASENCDFSLGDGTVDKVLARMMGILCNIFNGVFSRLEEFGTGLATTIREVIGSVVDAISRGIDDFIASITSGIAAVIGGLAAKVSEIIDSIVNTLAGIVDAITDQVRRIVDSLQDIVGGILDGIGTAVTGIVNKLSDGVAALVDKIGSVLAGIRDGIAAVIGTVVDAVWAVITRIGEGIGTLIDTLVGTAEAGLGRVRQVIEDIPTALRELAGEAQEFLGKSVGGPLANIGTLFVEQVEGFFKRLIDDDDVKPDIIVREFLTGIGMPAEEVERFAASATRAMPGTVVFQAAAMAFLVPMLLTSVASTVLSPIMEQLRQEVAQRVTPTLIPPADTIDAFIRGFMDEGTFRNELGEAGYTERKQDILVATSRRLIDVGEMFRWWLRDIINEDQLDQLLRFHKIDVEDRARLKEAVFFIPPVQDLIRMAVREVFTPTIRQRFELDEGFPAEFQESAKQQGVSEVWAKNYWAAHWVLPSITQGFAMLHRKVITAEDLDLLLRAQDVMPFWREKITQVAFNPLTRVDLRRMHRLGLLSEEDLQIRYEALGFDAANAELMVQFTIAFNEEDPPEVELELEGLTRSSILGMFDDGVLSEGETTEALQDLGISEAATSLFITQRRLEQQRKERTGLIENIVALVGGGHVDLGAGLDSLAGLGLTATEIAKATQRILNNRKGRDRLPTPTQLDKMLGLEIVSPEVWETAMAGLGFSDVWIERLALITKPTGTVGE